MLFVLYLDPTTTKLQNLFYMHTHKIAVFIQCNHKFECVTCSYLFRFGLYYIFLLVDIIDSFYSDSLKLKKKITPSIQILFSNSETGMLTNYKMPDL